MPQLKLLNRRWRVASDTLPILAVVLAIFHIGFIVPVLTVAADTESTTYTCNKKRTVQLSLFGILALYILSAFNEILIFLVGLRGGPLEEHKRRAMRPLLYIEFALWVCVLALTCLATFVATSPDIEQTCWSNNPCKTIRDVVPSSCTYEDDGDVTLTDACADLLANGEYFSDVCWANWFNYAATWSLSNYNASRTPAFNPATPESPCNKSISANSRVFETFAKANNFTEMTFTAEEAAKITSFSSTVESNVLESLGINHTLATASSVAPWFHCFSDKCQRLLRAGDACEDWDTLLLIPDSTDRKVIYRATVITSWVVVVLTALVVYFAFNAWPNYDSTESWESTVRSLSKLFCCSNVVQEASTDVGHTASQEIGKLLHLLFGGIDLDPSDQVLGMYLVAERQRWRRRRHTIKTLAEAGIEPLPPKPSRVRRIFGMCCPSKCGTAARAAETTLTAIPSHVVRSILLTSTLENPGAVPIEEQGPHSPHLQVLPASPFEDVPQLQPLEQPHHPHPPLDHGPCSTTQPQEEPSAKSTGAAAKRRPGFDKYSSIAYRPPSIAQSFVRLATIPRDSMVASTVASSLEQGGTPPAVGSNSITNGVGSQKITAESIEKALVVADRHQPLITPVDLGKVGVQVPISAYAAGKIYIGQSATQVAPSELEELLQMSRIAKAAYGLQTVRWKAAATGAMCTDTLDSCLACCSPLQKPLGLDNHFRKRNFQAILKLTGIQPEDLLYVSYTSAAYGVLPYMVLLHHATKSVVVTVRGTVGFEDLITDLLSSPEDASKGMPEWVLEEAARLAGNIPGGGESAGSGGGSGGSEERQVEGKKEESSPSSPKKKGEERKGGLYAHSGILSSTNAVLRDLESNGLLAAMLDAQRGVHPAGRNNGGSGGGGAASEGETVGERGAHEMLQRLETTADDDAFELSLDRAHSVVNDAVAGQGWRVVITGHSLGAAVACMLSFHLRQDFPSLKCFAFCPPGGLVSAPLSRMARQFCTSVVVGCDAISRLSITTTQRTVDDMVLALARCKRQKLAVLSDVVLGRRKDPATAPPTFCTFEDIGIEARKALEKYVATSKLHAAGLDMRELYPPGRIIHLRPFAAGKGLKGPEAEVWDAVWVGAEDVIGEGIVLSLSMTRHHRIPTLQYALRSAINGEATAQATESEPASSEAAHSLPAESEVEGPVEGPSLAEEQV